MTPMPATPAAPAERSSRRWWWIAGIGGASLIGIGMWLVFTILPRMLNAPQPGMPPPAMARPSTGSASAERTIHATLFYVADNGRELVPVSREVPLGATPADQARRIAEAQVAAPPEGRTSTIPAGTTVRSVFLTSKGEAYVDLAGPILTGHSGGSLAESLTVYAIVNALAVNLPDVSAVQILVEGKEVETLNGHLDLRQPLGRSLRWIQKGQ
ncbi:MAG TPA: GerMN domain-containing protein [Vicinamibacterales bacterium]|nr:GerMN domain-containing protein [Vicinamibacterales bacterium]